MKFFNRLFKIDQKQTSLKTEIIAGIVVFISMFYVLPLNATILHTMGMSEIGVFIVTAFISFLTCFIMGLVANYPLVLSTGMGLNSYLAFTVSKSLGFAWQESLILLTISGILFFIISLTPIRRKIIESMPKDIKLILAASLGAFICFVGLRNSGIIISNADTVVALGSLANPSTLLAMVFTIVCFGLNFVKNKRVASLAVPIAIFLVAITGAIISSVLLINGKDYAEVVEMNLPIVPWRDQSVSWGLDLTNLKDVFLYGLFSKENPYTLSDFGGHIVHVLSEPASYVAIFSIIFVNLFDTTATLFSVGGKVGIVDNEGKIVNYKRTVLADATGALICGPLGTSTVTSFAESNIAVEMGARTGLSSVVAGILFLISAFTYPIFSIFTCGCVTAPALVCVGTMIFVNNIKDISWNDAVITFTSFITLILTLLCYSISIGLGMGLITYVVMMLCARRRKEINVVVYVMALFFIVSFALTAIMPFLTKS